MMPLKRFVPASTAALRAGWSAGLSAALCVVTLPASAASLDTYAGVVGGSGQRGCTLVPAPQLADFFTFSSFRMPIGSVTGCGYNGSLDQATAAVGPLTLSNTLAPVPVGTVVSPGVYNGSAHSVARYGSVGASAKGRLVGQPGSITDLFQAVGAASFTDTLTASSPLVTALSAGFVSYAFSIDGRMATPGPQVAFEFSETYTEFVVQHQGGPSIQIFNANTNRRGVPTILNGPPPAGWTASVGSLAGGSIFELKDMPMVWGQPWELSAGLLAWAYGSGDNSFLSTAQLVGITLYNDRHEEVTSFDLSSASGTRYAGVVPEPSRVALLLAGLGLMAALMHRRRSTFATRTMVAAGSTPVALVERIAVDQRYWQGVMRSTGIRAE